MLSTSCCYLITPQSHHPKLLFTTNPYLSSSRILFLSTTLIFPLLGGPFPSLLYLYRPPDAWRNKERFSLTLLLPNLPFSLSLHPFNCQLCSLISFLLFPSKHCLVPYLKFFRSALHLSTSLLGTARLLLNQISLLSQEALNTTLSPRVPILVTPSLQDTPYPVRCLSRC